MSRRSSKLSWLKALAIATLATIAIPSPGRTAERITAYFPPFKDFSVSVRDLEAFAADGKVPAAYVDLAKQAPPEQLQQFRQSLRQRFDTTPTYINQLTRAPLVIRLFDRIGDSIQTGGRRNGSQAIRTALARAARDREGLTPLNFLRRFPSREVNLNLAEVFTIYDNLTELYKRRDRTIATLDRLAATAATTNTQRGFSTQVDLRDAGRIPWQRRQYSWLDRSRRRRVPADLYLPQTVATNLPVIVVSHGVAEDRTTYAYLARHLASHGFAVAVVAHTGGDANRFRNYFANTAPPPMATELLERPRDVSFVLDELQRRSQSDLTLRRLDLQNVGLVGHSLGGYTVLALAGAEIDFDRLKRDCNPNRWRSLSERESLNVSVLLQCRADELPPRNYALKDPRVRAIFAINPLGSTIFGRRGLSPIRVPVLLMGGSDDIITPAVPEQIYPFTWLQTPDKYLAIVEKGTHFSTQAIDPTQQGAFPVSDGLIGPDPAQARGYAQALSVAFFQTHLRNRSDFRPYLSAAYAKSLAPIGLGSGTAGVAANSRSSLRLNLVDASASDAISQSLQQDTSRAPKLVP
jgi:predicted dienelactone hydrolase